MKINWYPGHMAKTKRLMQEDIRQIDLVCELRDARIPLASRNPDLAAMAGQKKRIIILNRADQADPKQTEAWKAYFTARKLPVIALDSKTGRMVMDLFHQLNREQGKTIVLITHNRELAMETQRVLTMCDGVLSEEAASCV